ncbi:MAG TPA: VOC family protein [Myxococcales bacterium]|nr:VOC family protein [Myxococcales bacterium]HIL80329.1 VOC family protein [Myxococcales bacterium]
MTEASDPSWAPLSIFHFTVGASNFEDSLAFYQKIGFKLLRDNRDIVWPDYVAVQFGLERAQGRGALLGLGEGPEHTRLDLIEWCEPLADPPSALPLQQRVPRIIALRTRNVRAAYAALCADGIEFITPPRGPDAPTGIEAVVCCRDPDGLIVELIEYMPGVLGSKIEHLETRS